MSIFESLPVPSVPQTTSSQTRATVWTWEIWTNYKARVKKHHRHFAAARAKDSHEKVVEGIEAGYFATPLNLMSCFDMEILVSIELGAVLKHYNRLLANGPEKAETQERIDIMRAYCFVGLTMSKACIDLDDGPSGSGLGEVVTAYAVEDVK